MESVAVIGAGIVGTSIAYDIASRGGRCVVLIDPFPPGAGTSSSGMAWLNASNKCPQDYFDLNRAGVAEYHLLRSSTDAEWIHLTGSVASESYTPDLPGRVSELSSWGYRVERLRGRDVRVGLGTPVAVQGDDELFAHYPDEGWIDVDRALRHMLSTAASYPAFVHRMGASVIGIDRRGGSYRIRLSDGTAFDAQYVVNAAGPDSDRIASMLGRTLPLAPTYGMTIVLSAPEVVLHKVVLSDIAEVRPDGAGFFRVHSTTVDRSLAKASAVDRAELSRELRRRAGLLVPALANATLVRESVGVRPQPQDSYSSIGRVADLPNYVEAVTHSGVTLGPLVGRLVADLIDGEEPSDLLTPRFDPDRFSPAGAEV